jgi:hypothetical protein
MQFLTRYYFFNSVKTAPKKELYLASSAVDYLTWYKNKADEGTMLHLNVGNDHNQIVDALPENVNQIAHDGLFFKCTCHTVVASNPNSPKDVGTMKKYSCWLNTDNISLFYENQPDDCILFFKSGASVLVCSKLPDLLKNLLEHGKMYKQRRKEKYGGNNQK